MPYPEKYQNYKSFGPQDMPPFREVPQQPQAAPENDEQRLAFLFRMHSQTPGWGNRAAMEMRNRAGAQEVPQQPQAAPGPDMLSSEDRIRRLQQDVRDSMYSPPDPMLEGVPQSTMSDAREMLVPPPNHIKVPDLLTGEEVWHPTKKRQPLARANPKKSAPPKRKPGYTLD
jgi:hypothetical protein